MRGPLRDPKIALFAKVERAFVAEISERAAHIGMTRSEALEVKDLARDYLRSLAIHQRNPDAACRDVEATYHAAEGIPGWTPRSFALAPTSLEQRITISPKPIPSLHLRFALRTTCWYRPADVVAAAYERFALSENEYDEDRYAQSQEFFVRTLQHYPYPLNGSAERLSTFIGQLSGKSINQMARSIGAYMRTNQNGELLLRPFYRVTPQMPFPSAQADFAAAFFTAHC